MLTPQLDRIIRTSSTSVTQHRRFHGRDARRVGGRGLLPSFLAMMAATQLGAAVAEKKVTDLSAHPEMSQERTLPLIAAGLRDNLLDAGSVTNFSACYPPIKIKLNDGKPVRWTIMLSLNSKNSLGGYTGLQQVAAVFSAEKPVRIISTGMPPSSKLLSTCTRIPDAKIRQLIGGE